MPCEGNVNKQKYICNVMSGSNEAMDKYEQGRRQMYQDCDQGCYGWGGQGKAL